MLLLLYFGARTDPQVNTRVEIATTNPRMSKKDNNFQRSPTLTLFKKQIFLSTVIFILNRKLYQAPSCFARAHGLAEQEEEGGEAGSSQDDESALDLSR